MTEATTFPIRVLGEAGESWTQLACILEGLLPIKIRRSGEGDAEPAAEIILGAPAGVNGTVRRIPRLHVPLRSRGAANGELTEIQVKFADESEVPFPFRGRTIQTKVSTEPNVLTLGAQEKVLANTASGPVWAVSVETGVKQFKSGLPLPEMPAGG